MRLSAVSSSLAPRSLVITPCRPSPSLRSGLDYEVVVVEDSSPDGTYEVALELQALFGEGRMKILKRPGKLGLGTAYIDGLKLATGDFVVLMDADLSHHVRGEGEGPCPPAPPPPSRAPPPPRPPPPRSPSSSRK